MPEPAFEMEKYAARLEQQVSAATVALIYRETEIETLKACINQQDQTIQELREQVDTTQVKDGQRNYGIADIPASDTLVKTGSTSQKRSRKTKTTT